MRITVTELIAQAGEAIDSPLQRSGSKGLQSLVHSGCTHYRSCLTFETSGPQFLSLARNPDAQAYLSPSCFEILAVL